MSDEYISPLAPVTSPLADVNPGAVNELIAKRIDTLMNKRPPYTDEELTVMIKYYQDKREVFARESAEKAAKGPTPRRSARAPTSVADALRMSEDLL